MASNSDSGNLGTLPARAALLASFMNLGVSIERFKSALANLHTKSAREAESLSCVLSDMEVGFARLKVHILESGVLEMHSRDGESKKAGDGHEKQVHLNESTDKKNDGLIDGNITNRTQYSNDHSERIRESAREVRRNHKEDDAGNE